MDRQKASQALAKAIAYVDCGKPQAAAEFLTMLLAQFAAEGVEPSLATPSLRQPANVDLSAASAWLGGRLLGREGSQSLDGA